MLFYATRARMLLVPLYILQEESRRVSPFNIKGFTRSTVLVLASGILYFQIAATTMLGNHLLRSVCNEHHILGYD